MITISATIEVLIDEADQLLAQAEREKGRDLPKSLRIIHQGLGKLLQAFLVANDRRSPSGLKEQFELCMEIEPEFVSVEDEMDFLLSVVPEEVESEDVIDTANEVWDFMIDLLENGPSEDLDDPDETD